MALETNTSTSCLSCLAAREDSTVTVGIESARAGEAADAARTHATSATGTRTRNHRISP